MSEPFSLQSKARVKAMIFLQSSFQPLLANPYMIVSPCQQKFNLAI
jgi:hypothetical protein